MNKGKFDLQVENRARVASLVVGVYVLTLPSRLILKLDNCYHIPTITKNIISNSCLDKKGFIVKDKSCSLYMDSVSTLMYL